MHERVGEAPHSTKRSNGRVTDWVPVVLRAYTLGLCSEDSNGWDGGSHFQSGSCSYDDLGEDRGASGEYDVDGSVDAVVVSRSKCSQVEVAISGALFNTQNSWGGVSGDQCCGGVA